MKYLTLLLALLAGTPAYTEARRYQIDPEHLTIGFLVDHVGFAKVFGRFREASGHFTFDEETGTISDVRVVVQTASVDTTVEARDQHLRSEDFLDVESFPEMIFEADRAVLDGRKGKLPGRLTLRGIEKPLTLSVTWNKSGVSPLPGNPYVAGFSARGSFDRSDYGMTYGVADGLVGNEVELIIELEAQRQGHSQSSAAISPGRPELKAAGDPPSPVGFGGPAEASAKAGRGLGTEDPVRR